MGHVLRHIINEDPMSRILVLSYRQSLSYELGGSKLKEHGFVNYLDTEQDLTKSDRIIMQVDSLDKLTASRMEIPQFDYVIIDEIESLLMHLSAKTLRAPNFLITKLMFCLKGTTTKRPQILALDALWGESSYQFWKICGITQKTIQNLCPPKQTKTYQFLRCTFDWWCEEICSKLRDGKNVVLQTLSREHGLRVMEMAIQRGDIGIVSFFFTRARSAKPL